MDFEARVLMTFTLVAWQELMVVSLLQSPHLVLGRKKPLKPRQPRGHGQKTMFA
ncbi:mCG132517 [Mus musculus]|nr:mCG132517 [Mus musculus]